MKIVLRDDVANLGQKGDVVDVADGYARNFLVPRGFAIKAESGVVKQAEAMRRLYSGREWLYSEAISMIVDEEQRTPQMCAREIVEAMYRA